MKNERWRRGPLATHEKSSWYQGGQVIWSQMLYLRDYVELDRSKKFEFWDLDKAKILKMVSLAEVLGFPDFAIELLDHSVNTKRCTTT
jgi:hypothetical protein